MNATLNKTQIDDVFITYLSILNGFFNERGYALSYLFLRRQFDRDGSIIFFSNIFVPPIGKTYVKTTYIIEFIDYTIINFLKIESRCFHRKKTDIKAIKEKTEPNESKKESIQDLERELASYCNLLDELFIKT